MITAEHDGLTVTSSDGTEDELRAELQPVADNEKPDGAHVAALDTAEGQRPAEPVKPQPRSNPEDRVRQATGETARYRRELDAANAELARLRATPAPHVERLAEKAPAGWERFKTMPGAPRLGEFEGETAFEDFLVAQSAFVAEKFYETRQATERQSAQQSQQEAAEMEHYRGFEKKLHEAVAADPDFLSTIDPRLTDTYRLSMLPAGQTPTFGNWLVEQIYRAEPVKELLVHFSNETEVQRLMTLQRERGTDAATREFMRLEARLSPAAAPAPSTPAPKPTLVSHAKPPIRVERGSAQVGSDGPPGDDASDADHEAYYAKVRAKYR